MLYEIQIHLPVHVRLGIHLHGRRQGQELVDFFLHVRMCWCANCGFCFHRKPPIGVHLTILLIDIPNRIRSFTRAYPLRPWLQHAEGQEFVRNSLSYTYVADVPAVVSRNFSSYIFPQSTFDFIALNFLPTRSETLAVIDPIGFPVFPDIIQSNSS